MRLVTVRTEQRDPGLAGSSKGTYVDLNDADPARCRRA